LCDDWWSDGANNLKVKTQRRLMAANEEKRGSFVYFIERSLMEMEIDLGAVDSAMYK
jgi:hypothetical protein